MQAWTGVWGTLAGQLDLKHMAAKTFWSVLHGGGCPSQPSEAKVVWALSVLGGAL